ncbi:unnamed protein product [Cuscuta campestris]|uniref:WIT1/2 N-terminal helical bundle domain-containing protein n=1 Tax=Cuscuta campestris TaxID=132261 RepID=A0A484KU90_9ASTE|nr:unnamed protein product [Cuscuta campestris]
MTLPEFRQRFDHLAQFAGTLVGTITNRIEEFTTKLRLDIQPYLLVVPTTDFTAAYNQIEKDEKGLIAWKKSVAGSEEPSNQHKGIVTSGGKRTLGREHQDIIDCGLRTVRIKADDGGVVKVKGELFPKPPEFVSLMQAKRLIRKRCEAFLCNVRDVRKTTPELKDIPSVIEGADEKSRLAMFTAALQEGLLHTDFTTHLLDTFGRIMDADFGNDGSSELEAESNNADSAEVILSSGESVLELDVFGKLISKIELDLACSSEKLVNMNVLKMLVETRENYFEAVAADDQCFNGCADKALEFDLLSVLLDSEVRELSAFLSTLQLEIDYSHQIIPTFADEGEHCRLFKEKLYDSEGLLQHLQEQLLELEAQSSNFMVTENWKDVKPLESFELASPLTPNTKIKMQTAEQQRHVLQMLEKSLANELDLEKKLSETKQSEEELKLGLQQQLLCVEIEVEDACERLFGAENATQVLLEVSKELRGQLQTTQLDLNSALQREVDLKSKLKDLNELLSAKESLLQKSENTCEELRIKLNSADKQLNDSEFLPHNDTKTDEKCLDMKKVCEMEARISGLTENNAIAESRFQIAEAECKSLKDANMELNEDLITLRNSSSITSERVCLLEKQLKESELNLKHAVASEASQEKQTNVNFTIRDMENLIDGLNLKLIEAEEKCIILSEANADLNDELEFLKEGISTSNCVEACVSCVTQALEL